MAAVRRYALQELIDLCDPESAPGAEELAWLDTIPVGLEIMQRTPAPSSNNLADVLHRKVSARAQKA